MKKIYYKILGFIILILLSIPLMYYIKSTGVINGADIYGHLYKTDTLYNNIKAGNFFTLYDSQWYNGIQMFRYWPPLSYYFLALLQFLCNGVIENAYILLAGITFIVGGYAWILFGSLEDKKILGIIFSIIYWFIPDNLRIFFCEGNLPRIIFVMLFPYFLLFIWKYIKYNKKSSTIGIILISITFVFTHLMMSAIVGIGITIFLLLYFLFTKEFKRPFISVLSIICGYLIGGIVLLPGLMGGIVSQDSSASVSTIGDWAQALSISLNPIKRFDEPTIYYFGISLLIGLICLLRIAIVKNKLLFPPLITSILIMICTSSSLTKYIELLPLSQIWWMERFTMIAINLFLFSFFLLKKDEFKIGKFIIILLLIIDIIPSLKLIGSPSDTTLEATQKSYDERYLYNIAEQNTSNRLAIVDESLFGSYESFFIKNKKINITTGWALQGAQTYQNIVYLNEALASNSYSYLFDRLINLGADTAIINKQLLDLSEYSELKEIGNKYNYEVLAENSYCILFKLKNVNYTFGVEDNYENIAIGTSARYISLIYPSFKNTNKLIDEYNVDELKQYKKIYLSGKFYKNKAAAERIVQELSNDGVKIYIDINKIKQDFQGYQTFLNCQARVLTLVEQFPDLSYKNNLYNINYDIKENWNASYITNIEDTDEYFNYANQKYSYLRKDGNITYIGMNLIYFYNQYPTEKLLNILNDIFDVKQIDLIITKNIKKINLDVDLKNNQILVNSPIDNLNTTLSYQDFFGSKTFFTDSDNLLIVNKGENILKFSYKYFKEGMIVSVIGIILAILLIIYITIDKKERDASE